MQGQHECQVLGRGPEAAESEIQWQRCHKNPGHVRFIPVKDFAMKHMPSELRDAETFRTFKVLADLTVRLRIQYTSEDRPSDDPLSIYGGKDDLRTGSGLITGVTDGQGPCPCIQCSGKQDAGERYWFVYMRTARHVVYDSSEARWTKVDLFCDDDDSHKDGTMKSLKGVDMEIPDAEDDFCLMRCVLHDEAFALQLQELTHSANLGMEFKMTWFSLWGRDEFLDHFVILIISHPHGKPKRVTVGKMKKVDVKPSAERDKMYITESYGPVSFEYTTATCPGSSGAPLIHMCLPITIRNGDLKSVTRRPISADGWVHSGALGSQKACTSLTCIWAPRCRRQVNYSCIVNSFNPYWGLQTRT